MKLESMATTIVLQSVPSSRAMRQVRRGLAQGQFSVPCLIRVQMKDEGPGKTMGSVTPHVPPLGEKAGCGGTHTTEKMHLPSGSTSGRQAAGSSAWETCKFKSQLDH